MGLKQRIIENRKKVKRIADEICKMEDERIIQETIDGMSDEVKRGYSKKRVKTEYYGTIVVFLGGKNE